ncbi:hypothetical protein J6590_091538 [Homalodisca vitripennis]|nr:hypothetical protein J6590_091538 [Homalodisca vitripennis]
MSRTVMFILRGTQGSLLVELYTEVLWQTLWWNIWATSTLAYYRRARLSNVLEAMQEIIRKLKRVHASGKLKATKVLSVLLIAVYTPGMVMGIIDHSRGDLTVLGYTNITAADIAMAAVVIMPESLVFWTVLYGLALVYVMEVEFIGNLAEIIGKGCQDVTSVLPVIEGDRPAIYRISGQEQSLSTHCCSHWYRKLHHPRKLFKITYKIKDFHLKIEIFFNGQATLIIFSNVLFLPMVFVEPYYPNDEFTQRLHIYSSYVNFFWVIAAFAPILFIEWSRIRNQYLSLQTSTLIFSADQPYLRKYLSRIAFIATHQYPDTPWNGGIKLLNEHCKKKVDWCQLEILQHEKHRMIKSMN